MKAKFHFTLLALLLSIAVMAQSPQMLNYQAVLRNSAGDISQNQSVNVEFIIHSGSANGPTVYAETHNANTNEYGLVNLQIGNGNGTSGNFSNIDWSAGSFYLQVKVDGGNTGTQELASVPYSLYASKAGSAENDNDTDPANEIQTLSVNGTELTLSNGGGTVSISSSGPTGPQGPPGPQGAAGPAGPQGAAGPAGPAGAPGATGPAGQQGATGPMGPQGSPGQQGAAGAGVQIIGSVASAANLPPAYNGSVGDMFISQNNGHGHVWNGASWDDVGQIQGPAGPQGPQGIAGPAGAAGPQGNPGPMGATGATGQQGSPGPAGATGPQGIPGPMGTTGAPGPQGATGPQGTPGAAGAPGATGPQGTQGIPGPAGPQGPPGPTYTAGTGISITGTTISANEADPEVGANTVNYLPKWNGTALVKSSAVFEDMNGKVGIGTASPTQKLDVRGNGPDDGSLMVLGNSDLSHRLTFFSGREFDPNPFIQWKDGDPLRFSTDAGGWSEKMRISSNGDVGIGTSSPGARLHIEGGALLAQGTLGGTPVSGAGTRLMWIPAKAAFRAGEVFSTQWDDVNIGENSFVGGGGSNTASGGFSFVGGGIANTASGLESFVGGSESSSASGDRSFIGGGLTNAASGGLSFVGGGQSNTASGSSSFVSGGFDNNAAGHLSFIGGGGSNTTSGERSFIGGGSGALAKSYSESVFGTFNTDYTPVSTSGINAADRLFVIGNGTSTSARSNAVTVLKNGNVGIGDDSPDVPLHVNNPIPRIYLVDNDNPSSENAASASISAYGNNYNGSLTTGRMWFLGSLSSSNNDIALSNELDGGNLHFRTEQTTRMTVDSSGNVGIGTTTPANKLDVEGGLAIGAAYSGTSTAPANGAIIEGNVGIGTSSPLTNLSITPSALGPKVTLYDFGSTVNHGGFGYSSFQMNYHVLPNDNHVFYAGGKNGNGTELMRIQGDGKVGIGLDSPTADLHIKQKEETALGSGGIRLERPGAATQQWKTFIDNVFDYNFSYNGVLKAWIWDTDGSYHNSSDRRLKKNIEPLPPVLSNLMQLNPVRYHFLDVDETTTKSFGLIAQEVQPLFPDIVGEKNGYLSMNYGAMGIVAIQAIQEQQAIIEAQQAEIEAQKTKIEAIEKALAKAGISLD